jgi:hypothetical protein
MGFRLDEENGSFRLYVKVDDDAEVDCGLCPTPGGPSLYLEMTPPYKAAGTGTTKLYQVRRKANCDPDLDP